MAYFANGSEGSSFEEQCSKCKYGKEPCPIAYVQLQFNYEACNNEVATSILAELVKDNGDCVMFNTFETDLNIWTAISETISR